MIAIHSSNSVIYFSSTLICYTAYYPRILYLFIDQQPCNNQSHRIPFLTTRFCECSSL